MDFFCTDLFYGTYEHQLLRVRLCDSLRIDKTMDSGVFIQGDVVIL
jgi:hypothetical protein